MVLFYCNKCISESKMCEIERNQYCLPSLRTSCQNHHGPILKPGVKMPREYDSIPDLTNFKVSSCCGSECRPDGLGAVDASGRPGYVGCRCRGVESARSTAGRSSDRMSSHLDGSYLGGAIEELMRRYRERLSSAGNFRNRATQTDYRESECQTLPWEPPYVVRPGQDPEVLTLSKFTWGKELPAGMHELEIINRMRMKRAWEKILPPMDTPENIKLRVRLVTAIEDNELAYRDAEIQFLMDIRMDLALEQMEVKESEASRRTEARCQLLSETLERRRRGEMKRIRIKFSRESRRLACKHRAFKSRIGGRECAIDRHVRRELDYRCAGPRYDSSRILREILRGTEVVEGPECSDESPPPRQPPPDDAAAAAPSWLLPKSRSIFTSGWPPRPVKQICPREAKRDERRLLKLQRSLEPRETPRPGAACELRQSLRRKERLPSLPPTPRRGGSPQEESVVEKGDEGEEGEEEASRSASLLQRLVRGRAMQCAIIEGRYRYRELIEELRSAQAMDADLNEKLRMKLLQEEEERKTLQEQRVNEILEALEGKTIANMLTCLNQELIKLESEKRAHMLLYLAEKERVKRDIEQASKEQLEVNRREELDEIYRQVLKVNQETAELYLEDIVKDEVDWAAEQEAERYVLGLADQVDAMVKYMEEHGDEMDNEGIVTDMVYNFLLPEVKRRTEREALADKERSYLRDAHGAVYDAILDLVQEDGSPTDEREDGSEDADESHGAECAESVCETKESEESNASSSDYHINFDKFDYIINEICCYAGVHDEASKADVHYILDQKLRCSKQKN